MYEYYPPCRIDRAAGVDDDDDDDGGIVSAPPRIPGASFCSLDHVVTVSRLT